MDYSESLLKIGHYYIFFVCVCVCVCVCMSARVLYHGVKSILIQDMINNLG